MRDAPLERAGRDPSVGCAVLFVDLDDFKLVNDRLGHSVGDQLLVAVAERFHDFLRPGDTVARIGGDEFALLLGGVMREQDATVVAVRLERALAEPVELGGHKLSVSASVGIAFASPGVTATDLLCEADVAMYNAKRRGKAGHALYGRDMHRRLADQVFAQQEDQVFAQQEDQVFAQQEDPIT